MGCPLRCCKHPEDWSTCTRGQQLNTNSVKSVSDSSKQGKGKSSRNAKKASHKTKKAHPFMMISEEDFKWLKGKNNQVKELFLDCWLSDPYGSRWMPLNHSLKTTSFRIARKALSEAGLFLFRRVSSIRDSREIVCWEVLNLHGSRQKEYWYDQEKTVKNPVRNATGNHGNATGKNGNARAISSKSYTESQSQKPSRSPQERLTNSSKEFSEAFGVDGEVSESDRDLALGGQVTSASLQEEKVKAEETNLGDVQSDLVTKSNQSSNQKAGSADEEASPALNKKSILNKESTKKVLNQPYMENRFSEESIIRSVAQNLAIDEEQKSETYQTSFKDAIARIKAKLQEQSERDKKERFGF